jgi:hypothetical protein
MVAVMKFGFSSSELLRKLMSLLDRCMGTVVGTSGIGATLLVLAAPFLDKAWFESIGLVAMVTLLASGMLLFGGHAFAEDAKTDRNRWTILGIAIPLAVAGTVFTILAVIAPHLLPRWVFV